MPTLTARQIVLLVALFLVTSFTFIALDNGNALDPVRNGVQGLVVPVTQIFKSDADGNSGDPASLQAKYENLRKKYATLQAQNAQLTILAQEVNQLRALLNLKQQQPNLKIVSATVLYPDPAGGKAVIIDRGSADGVEEGMAVTDPNYFVGLVTKVEAHQSRVVLAIDDSQSVGAQLQKTGDVGIAWGMWGQGGRMELRHVDRAANVDENDLVVTAIKSEARTSKVPGGLIIGQVGGPPVTDNQGDTETIPIIPAADFDHLTVVAVIISDGSGG